MSTHLPSQPMAIPTEIKPAEGAGNEAQLDEAFAEIKKRYKRVHVHTEQHQGPDGRKSIELKFPGRSITVDRLDQANKLRSSPIELYVLLENYEATYRRDEGTIEAAIGTIGFGPWGGSGRHVLPILQERLGREFPELVLSEGENKVVVKPASDIIYGLFPETKAGSASLVLNGLRPLSRDEASAILEQISNSLFFQIEQKLGLTLGLRRVRTPGPSTQRPSEPSGELRYPAEVYDKTAMELYWFATSVPLLPHFQFLAFYQVIECHFLQNTSAGKRVHDRERLEDTLREYLKPDSLREYLQDKQRSCFFAEKTRDSPWPTVQVGGGDLLADVARRIYQVRNDVVHSKYETGGRDRVRSFLPLSRNPLSLKLDIDLVRHVARAVLIAAGGDKGLSDSGAD